MRPKVVQRAPEATTLVQLRRPPHRVAQHETRRGSRKFQLLSKVSDTRNPQAIQVFRLHEWPLNRTAQTRVQLDQHYSTAGGLNVAVRPRAALKYPTGIT